MRWAGVGAAIIAAAVDVLYLGIVATQGASDPQFLRVPFVATFIALMAIGAALSSRASAARWRPLLLGVSAAGLLLLGFFAIFSVGLPLLAAGVLALLGLINALSPTALSAGPSRRAAGAMAASGAVLAVAVLLAGFSLAEVVIKCPASGVEGGGGTRLLGGSYSYTCDNGKLTISR
ncbi:MAG TPA: hypothetical protein VG413_05765 [Candidatus Dormibacteraeota bacterium]|jgi:hypothetical protein|nr:hypothetical protein [Candidatus Dormibacteraeota bacterium]